MTQIGTRPSTVRDVLRHRPYRFLVAGTGVTSLGNAITPVALAFAVLELGGTATELGVVVAVFAAAEVITIMFGGVLGDRVSRRLMMQGSAAATAVTQTVMAVSLIAGWATIPMIAAIGMLNGCLGALSGPSSQAMTRQTVPAPDLADAVTVRRLTSQAAQVLGFASAGMIVAAFGSGWAIAVDALTFALAAVFFSLIDVPGAAVAAAGSKARRTLLGDLREGAAEVFRHTWLWLLISQALLYHLFYGGVQGVLGPIVAKDTWTESAWGWALSALMGGFILGGLTSLRWRPRRGLLIGTLMLSLTAAFPIAMALSDSIVVLLAGAALHGFGLEIFSVNWDLSIQQNVSEDKLARVYAFDMVGSFVARPLGLVVAGPISALVGMTPWLIVVGCIMGGTALLSTLLPSVRGLERHVTPG
ncbi:putative transmembrane efflux protein [Janibacter sp. HTCC2649]|uniref:MFS transporter n=1 Tax=Janibacter sp. HTCC2649 TaxID=313589 RepID=UPI0000671860|nr:MFS transporter [Janibacter sp. HTCC2649]EAP98335.1 putative transmembrane efflux protein [Janibacter sp. HTCC2649]